MAKGRGRKPLTRADRERRAAKRDRRQHRHARAVGRLEEAAIAYEVAVQHWDYEPERVVCERCGLEQAKEVGTTDDETGLVTVFACEGFDGIGCGSLVAVTPESLAE